MRHGWMPSVIGFYPQATIWVLVEHRIAVIVVCTRQIILSDLHGVSSEECCQRQKHWFITAQNWKVSVLFFVFRDTIGTSRQLWHIKTANFGVPLKRTYLYYNRKAWIFFCKQQFELEKSFCDVLWLMKINENKWWRLKCFPLTTIKVAPPYHRGVRKNYRGWR